MNVLLSLLLAAASTQDDLSRLVSAEVRAASAPVAIAELSKQIGYPLEAMPSTKDDYLIIRVERAPLGVLMDKIAKTTNTAWEKRDRGYRLVRNAETLRSEAAEEKAEFEVEVQTALDRIRKEREGEGELNEKSAAALANRMFDWQDRQVNGAFTNDYQAYQQIQNSLPINRMARSIITMLDASTIASVSVGRRLVFASQPNRMQRPLPGRLGSIWQTYVREQDIWNKTYAAVKERRQAQERYFMGNSGSLASAQTGKIILAITRRAETSSLYMTLTAIDSKGRMIGSANESLTTEPRWGQAQADIAKMGAEEKPIKFEGISKRLFDALQAALESARRNNGQPDMQVEPEVKSILLHPEKFEPLSMLASEAIIGAAKARGANLVCSAGDTLFFGIGLGMPGEVKPAQVLAALPMAAHEAETQDGWITINPTIPSATRRARTNRVALGQFYRQCDKDGRVSLDNHAAFAYRSGLEDESSMHMIVLMLTGILRAGVEFGFDWSASKLFGSLTPAQKQAVRLEQPILLRSFSPEQVEILRHHLFDRAYTSFETSYSSEDFSPEDGDGPFFGLSSEATEILPNGLTGSEEFLITDKSESQYFSVPDQEGVNGMRFGETALTAQGIAHEMFQRERPEMFPWLNQPGYPQRTFSKFRIGTQRTVSIRAEVTRRAAINMQLREKLVSGAAVPLDKLPEQHRKLIQDELAKLREQYKNMKPPEWNPGGGGQRTPPPN